MKYLLVVFLCFGALACSRRHDAPSSGNDASTTEAPKPSFGGAGDGVGNGGGIGEKNVLFAFLNLPGYLARAATAPRESFSDEDRALLEKVRRSLEGHVRPERIVFDSEHEHPGTFKLDGRAHGVVRSAKTGGLRGDALLINRDHLYPVESDGQAHPIDIASAAALLLDETAHAVEPRFSDDTAHAKLDLAAARLKIYLMASTQKITFQPFFPDLSATAIHFPGRESFTQLLLSDDSQLFDLTKVTARAVACPPGDRLVGTSIWNLHWHKTMGFDDDAPTIDETLHAWITIYCKEAHPRPENQGLPASYSNQMLVHFTVAPVADGDWIRALKITKPWPRVEILDCGDEREGAKPDGTCH